MVEVSFRITDHRFPWYWEITGRYCDLDITPIWRYAEDAETAGSRAVETLSQIIENYWQTKQMEIDYGLVS